MREIKAWDKRNKQMKKVWAIDYQINEVELSDKFDGYWTKFEDVILLQYTGLKDKYGVEIYEGDIVRWQDERDVYSIEFGEFGVPNFEEEGYQDLAVGYYLKPQHDLKEVEPFNMTISLHEKYASQMEVIGNIYEHSYLLE